MTSTRRALTAALTSLVLGAGLAATASAPAQADPNPPGHVHLNDVGERYSNARIPIVGYLVAFGDKHDKTLVLQRKRDGKWRTVTHLWNRADGRFKFPARRVYTPQKTRWRVQVKSRGRVLHTSEVLVVTVIPAPVA